MEEEYTGGVTNPAYAKSNGDIKMNGIVPRGGGEKSPGTILRRISRSSSMSSQEARQLELAIRRIEEEDEGTGAGQEETGDELSLEEEWRVVAMTIDYGMFIFFMILFVLGTIGCFAGTKYIV